MDIDFYNYLEASYPHVLAYPESVLDAITDCNRGPWWHGNYRRYQEVQVRRAWYSPILWAGKKALVAAHGYTLNHYYRNYFYTVIGLEEPVIGKTRRFQNQYLTDRITPTRALSLSENRLVDTLTSFGVTRARATLHVQALTENWGENAHSVVDEQRARIDNLYRLPGIHKISGPLFGYSVQVEIKKPKFSVRAILAYPNTEPYTIKLSLAHIFGHEITPELADWFDKLLVDHTIEVELPKNPEFNLIRVKYHMEETEYSLVRHAN